ncbi:MAG: 4-hydroxythreonine-4-phosphate dehydrogenase PdxA [Rhizobiales bacterium NRL2]|jgi:4-hydroxythreonine-4-phosphate dehydrogenase|nr:MAG: 4-hydroxythreonine-4-phosphate dehydrogenase PdxA [Rhizobiales bacterium NRL2]
MKPLAVTMGEPAGIGGDITLAAWRDRGRMDLPPFFVIDDPARLERLARRLEIDAPVVPIRDPSEAAGVFAEALPVLAVEGRVSAGPGRPDPADAPLVIAAIERAVALCLEGGAAGVVTNPINKAELYRAGFTHPGHTEFIGHLCGGARAVMMLAGPSLRVVPATIHLPLADAVRALKGGDLVAIGRIVLRTLRDDFGIDRPRLAFAGLNPHAGENGALGREDIDIIAPAVAELARGGDSVVGPLPADTMFHAPARAEYDAAICMYHDQALIPVKALDFDSAVNVTLGLPIVRTSPDHGTAFDIAGRGVARPHSLISAIRLAGEIAGHRRG